MSRLSSAKIVTMNRRMWNEMALWWTESVAKIGLDAKFFRNGGVSFDSVELFPQFQAPPRKRRQMDLLIKRLAGPVKGRKVLDLQCGCGEAALSWANLGARVWGLDRSDARINEAQKKARGARVRVTYVKANALRTPFRSNFFDLVYTGGGVLCWIPNISRWGKEVARILKPGGRLVLLEYHPFLHAITWKRLRPHLTGDYFNQNAVIYRDKAGRPSSAETNWKVSDVVNVLIENRMTMLNMVEFPFMSLWAAKRFRFPHRILLLFQKRRD